MRKQQHRLCITVRDTSGFKVKTVAGSVCVCVSGIIVLERIITDFIFEVILVYMCVCSDRCVLSHLRSSFRHSLPPLPQLPVQQGLHAVPTTVPTQSFELLQVLPLLHGQSFRACQQTAPWYHHKHTQVITESWEPRPLNMWVWAQQTQLLVYLFTQRVMLHFAVVQVSTLLLLQQVLQPFELVDVERLEPDELFSSDESHFLCCVYSCMSRSTHHT